MKKKLILEFDFCNQKDVECFDKIKALLSECCSDCCQECKGVSYSPADGGKLTVQVPVFDNTYIVDLVEPDTFKWYEGRPQVNNNDGTGAIEMGFNGNLPVGHYKIHVYTADGIGFYCEFDATAAEPEKWLRLENIAFPCKPQTEGGTDMAQFLEFIWSAKNYSGEARLEILTPQGDWVDTQVSVKTEWKTGSNAGFGAQTPQEFVGTTCFRLNDVKSGLYSNVWEATGTSC